MQRPASSKIKVAEISAILFKARTRAPAPDDVESAFAPS
jgi:hypothetical protein